MALANIVLPASIAIVRLPSFGTGDSAYLGSYDAKTNDDHSHDIDTFLYPCARFDNLLYDAALAIVLHWRVSVVVRDNNESRSLGSFMTATSRMAINLRYPVSLDPSLRSIADNETWFVSAYALIRLAAWVAAFQLTVDDKQTHGAGYENECTFECLLA